MELPRTLAKRYRLEATIGRGGMGEVFRGTDTELDRAVAVKLIQGHIAEQEDVLERFRLEAQTCGRIDSAHVVNIYDFGVDRDERYLVMEYLHGRSLSEILREQTRMPPALVRKIATQICHGLGAAHAVGVVHRDLKPGNVMLVERDGNPHFVKVLDFGIAKKLDGEEITKTGALVGTVDYMAPEMIKGEDFDGRADMYALGVLMYRLLSGTRLFAGTGEVPGFHNVYSKPEPFRDRVPLVQIPPTLEAIVMRCLEKEPADRFADLHAVASALVDVDLDDGTDTRHLLANIVATSSPPDDSAPTEVTPGSGFLDATSLTAELNHDQPEAASPRVSLALGISLGLFLVVTATLSWLILSTEDAPLPPSSERPGLAGPASTAEPRSKRQENEAPDDASTRAATRADDLPEKAAPPAVAAKVDSARKKLDSARKKLDSARKKKVRQKRKRSRRGKQAQGRTKNQPSKNQSSKRQPSRSKSANVETGAASKFKRVRTKRFQRVRTGGESNP